MINTQEPSGKPGQAPNAAIGLVSAGASVALLLTVAALARRITGQRSGDRRSAP